jgi:hypothetical protein
MDNDRSLTIESRQAHSTVDAAEIKAWAEFTMAFVQSASVSGEGTFGGRAGHAEERWSFIKRGLSDVASVSDLCYDYDLCERRHGSLDPLALRQTLAKLALSE